MQILKLLTVLSIIFLLQTCFIFSNKKVLLEIAPIKSQLNAADDLVFYLTTKNNSDHAIKYTQPSFDGGNLKINLELNGENPKKYFSTYCGAPRNLTLNSKSEASDLLDLGDSYGSVLGDGNYTLNVETIFDDSIKISSNTIYFEIEPLTEEEESVKAAYLLLYYKNKNTLDTGYAHQILTQYPNTIFKNKICQIIAEYYSYHQEYQKSIFEYEKILDSIDDIHYRDEILYRIADAHKKNENLALAISTLKKRKDLNYYLITNWEHELEWNKKNQ